MTKGNLAVCTPFYPLIYWRDINKNEYAYTVLNSSSVMGVNDLNFPKQLITKLNNKWSKWGSDVYQASHSPLRHTHLLCKN